MRVTPKGGGGEASASLASP